LEHGGRVEVLIHFKAVDEVRADLKEFVRCVKKFTFLLKYIETLFEIVLHVDFLEWGISN
jgi:hypothetical protein